MFKWCCLVGAAVVSAIMLWMINDLRLHVRQSVDTINRDLPVILEKSRTSADTFSTLSQDIKQLRELIVGDSSPRESNLVAYETEVLKLIEDSNGKIGVKKMIGKGLADPIPARDWVTRERKSTLLDLALSRSKSELLDKIGHSSVLKRSWYIDTGEKEIMTLVDWIKANHPGTRELDEQQEQK